MTGIEIFLILIGVAAIASSFIFASHFDSREEKKGDISGLNEAELKQKINEAVESAVENAVEDAIDNVIDRKVDATEEQLEKLSNEKIMAVSDYSTNVMTEINKNHEEVMFLYGMLNDKEKEIQNAVLDVETLKKSVKLMGDEITGNIEKTVEMSTEQVVNIVMKKEKELTEIRLEKEKISELAAMKEVEMLAEAKKPKRGRPRKNKAEAAKADKDKISTVQDGNSAGKGIITESENILLNEETIAIDKYYTNNEENEASVNLDKGNISAEGDYPGGDAFVNQDAMSAKNNSGDNIVEMFEYKNSIDKDNIYEMKEIEDRASMRQNLTGVRGGKNNNKRILELFDEGKDNIEIAKELGLGIGEVRLVIDLYKNRNK